jgi:hypothetical protein
MVAHRDPRRMSPEEYLFFLEAPGTWTLRIYRSIGESIMLESLRVELPVADIYGRITLPHTEETDQHAT